MNALETVNQTEINMSTKMADSLFKPIDGLLFLFIFFSVFFVLIHDYTLCFTGSPYGIFSYFKFSYYNYISI